MDITPRGTILNGKYRILNLIGGGGVGRVWLAEEPNFGRRLVAIKEPRTDLPATDRTELFERYRHEVELSALLSGDGAPNIVHALTAEPYGESLLLVMDYMPGGDVSRLIQSNPGGVPLERAARLTQNVLLALRAAHNHPMLEIVHRDVKPSNILLASSGEAYLADFGIAQVTLRSYRTERSEATYMATPLYAAPEQLRGESVTTAADTYSVGCVLFELLTGRRLKRLLPGVTLMDLRPDLPAAVGLLIAKATADDPKERWSSVEEMANALRDAAVAPSGDVAPVAAPPVPVVSDEARQRANAATEVVAPPPPARVSRARPLQPRSQRLGRGLLATILGVLSGLVLVMILLAPIAVSGLTGGRGLSPVIAQAQPTDTPEPPVTPTELPTELPSATATSAPKQTPQVAIVPASPTLAPTATPVPPTPVPATPMPATAVSPTATAVPPTAVPTTAIVRAPAPQPTQPAPTARPKAPVSPELAAAVARVREEGYTVPSTDTYRSDSQLRALIGYRTDTRDQYDQFVFLFLGGDFLGTDLLCSSAQPTIVASDANSVTVDYALYRPNDPMDKPSGGHARVRYIWNGQRVVTEGTAPIPDWGAPLSRRSQTCRSV